MSWDRQSGLAGRAATRRRSPGLDALRGTAALFVLASHAYQWGGHSLPRRSLAFNAFTVHGMSMWVDVFFALSGFLVAGPWLRALIDGTNLPSRREYAIKRAGRILPAYWVALAALLLLVPRTLHWWQYPVHALLFQNLVPGQFQTVMFVAWTLSLEMIFYIALPVGIRTLRRLRPGRWSVDELAGFILACWLATHLVNPFLDRLALHSSPLSGWHILIALTHGLPGFALGMIVFLGQQKDAAARTARGWRLYEWLLRRPWRALVVATAFSFVARLLFSSPNLLLAQRNGFFSAIASALVLAVVVRRRPAGRMTRGLAFVGTISYGVYLWHWVILQTVQHLGLAPMPHGGAIAYGVHLAALLVGALGAAFASWVLLEQPLLEWCRRVAGRGQPTPTTLTPPEPVLAA